MASIKWKKYSAKSLTDLEPSKNAHVEFKIEFNYPNMKPIRCKVRPLSHNLKEKVKKALEEQESAGIIWKSYSAWSLALRIVHKQDGSVRITVDYTPLNAAIKMDAYPFPNIAELYKRLSESGLFSKIDLKAAYHQIPEELWSIQFTALFVNLAYTNIYRCLWESRRHRHGSSGLWKLLSPTLSVKRL